MTPEQLASELLFGDVEYVPNHPDREYEVEDSGEWISWTDLVARYRAERRS